MLKQNEKDWPKVYSCRILEPGLVSYEDAGAGVALLQRDAITKIMNTAVGKPVIRREHKDISPENFKEHAVGYMTSWKWNDKDGWAWGDFLITDDGTKKDIEAGYSVS